MDYMSFVGKHRESKADITVAALPMDNSRASDFGLMKVRPPHPMPLLPSLCVRAMQLRAPGRARQGTRVDSAPHAAWQIDNTGRILSFGEKPKGDALKAWAVDTTVLGLTKEEARSLSLCPHNAPLHHHL